uniref:Uncharacterized protein n=1 Tax=Meleagris gallopavo TaxID=9103 RepID=A0A803XXT6_MELGA
MKIFPQNFRGFPVVAAIAAISPRALWEFRSMIKCTIPDSHPFLRFDDY